MQWCICPTLSKGKQIMKFLLNTVRKVHAITVGRVFHQLRVNGDKRMAIRDARLERLVKEMMQEKLYPNGEPCPRVMNILMEGAARRDAADKAKLEQQMFLRAHVAETQAIVDKFEMENKRIDALDKIARAKYLASIAK